MSEPPYENVKCPDCGGEMKSRTGKFGVFWGCIKFPNCRGTRDSNGMSKAERDEERSKQKNYVTDDIPDQSREQSSQPKTSFNKKGN